MFRDSVNYFAAFIAPALLTVVATAKPPVTYAPKLIGEGAPVPFNAIQFSHDGSAKLEWLNAKDDGVSVGVRVTAIYGDTAPNLYLHGKKVTAAELESWASRTVDCEVRVKDDGLYFGGGKPAYAVLGLPPVQSGGCPCGSSCPCAAPRYYPTYPSFPSSCPNGRCPIPAK